MSRESRDATMPSFQTFSTWEVRRKSADSVDLPFLNPIWISGKSLASSATLLSLAAVIADVQDERQGRKREKKKRRSWGSRRSSYRQRIQRSKQATVQMELPGVTVCTVLSYPSIGLGQEVEGGLVLAGEECQGVQRGLVERGGGDT